MNALATPTEWIKVDDSKYGSDESRRVRNVVVHLSRSPYDVPRQVRSRFDEKSGALFLELKYLDDEPTREVKLDHHNFAHIGKHSNRIYSLEIGCSSEAAQRQSEIEQLKCLHAEMEKAFDELRMQAHVRERATNHTLTKKIISDYWNLLSGRGNRVNEPGVSSA